LEPFELEDKGNLWIINLKKENLSVAGLDLTVGEEIYAGTLRGKIEGIEELRRLEKQGKLERIKPDPDGRLILKHDPSGNSVYYIVSDEIFTLPGDLDLRIDARSTIGRLGVMCSDVSKQYIRGGNTSPVITTAQPYAFDIEVKIGESRLVQAILRYRQSPFMTQKDVLEDTGNIQLIQNNAPIPTRERMEEDGLTMTYDTRFALATKRNIRTPINVDAQAGAYEVKDFFEEIRPSNGELRMEGERFYLLRTKEIIRLGNVCGILSRENKYTGTGLWGHFAGFIWPQFTGPITMECRSESPRIVSNGDPAGFVLFGKLERELSPAEGYTGSYNEINPLAPKMFTRRTTD